MQSMPDAIQKTHFPMGADILITNISDNPINHVALKLLSPNIAPPVNPVVIAKVLDPDERIRLTMVDTEWYLQPGDTIEVSWHSADGVLKYGVTEIDCSPQTSELLPIGVAWIEDTASLGKLLNIANLHETRVLHDLLINTLTGHTIIPELAPGRDVRVSAACFSDSQSIIVGKLLVFGCKGYQSTIGVVAE